MVKVFTASHPTEAHLIVGLLGTAGIEAQVQNEALWGARGEVPPTPATLPTVWIADDTRVEEALALIGHHGTTATDATLSAPWRCAGCGEMVDPQFSDCWNCGTAGPAGQD